MRVAELAVTDSGEKNMNVRILTLTITAALLAASSASYAQPAERPMNGRFVRGAGEQPSRIHRAGSRERHLGTDPYSGSYLPAKEGPLANKTDEEVKRMITEGFGECDLVHQIIKDNATKDAAAKLDSVGNPGFRERY